MEEQKKLTKKKTFPDHKRGLYLTALAVHLKYEKAKTMMASGVDPHELINQKS